MPKPRKWNEKKLIEVVKTSKSYRSVISKLGLIPAGGNYEQIKFYIQKLNISIKHFTGGAWNKGMKGTKRPLIPMEKILIKNSNYQSYKLKNRLYDSNLKKPVCEECGWAKKSEDGRVPLELDHINGDRHDNRLDNLRILCPNCHSLKATHRGKNMRRA